jgi:hypothetical protein
MESKSILTSSFIFWCITSSVIANIENGRITERQLGLSHFTMNEQGNVYACGKRMDPHHGEELWIRIYAEANQTVEQELRLAGPGPGYWCECTALSVSSAHIFLLGMFNGTGMVAEGDSGDLHLENLLQDGATNAFLAIYRFSRVHNRYVVTKTQMFGSSYVWGDTKKRRKRDENTSDANQASLAILPRTMHLADNKQVIVCGDFIGNVYFFDGTTFFSERIMATFVSFIRPAAKGGSWENLTAKTIVTDPSNEVSTQNVATQPFDKSY